MKTLEELKQDMDDAWKAGDAAGYAAARGAAWDAYDRKLKEMADEDT